MDFANIDWLAAATYELEQTPALDTEDRRWKRAAIGALIAIAQELRQLNANRGEAAAD